MNNEEHINKMTEAAMSSLDGAARANVNPYLLTRINARMNKLKENSWDKAARFIARPVVIITGLCLLIGINALIMVYNHSSPDNSIATEQQLVTDDFSTSVATLYDTENTEP